MHKPGAFEEPFARDTGTGFDSSAYSEILDRGRADIRTPVIPHPERSAQIEAPRNKVAEPAAKHEHTKRVRRHSPSTSKALAASTPKSVDARASPSKWRLPSVSEVSARNTLRRKAAEQADALRRAVCKERTPSRLE